MTELEEKLWRCLVDVTRHVDEDCPQHHRTRHLNDAISDAHELIAEMHIIASKLPT
jgi:hypothetical protein